MFPQNSPPLYSLSSDTPVRRVSFVVHRVFSASVSFAFPVTTFVSKSTKQHLLSERMFAGISFL